MALQDIIQNLTDKHYNKSFEYYIFENNVKTDRTEKKCISELFTLQEWKGCITLLDKLQSQGQHDICFQGFWEHFLVGVDCSLVTYLEQVCLNSLNVEKYLKYILTLLGYNEDVKNLQEDGGAMSKVIHIACKKAKLFGDLSYAEDILNTLRCYGNWWRHGKTKTSDDDKNESRNAMIIPELKNDPDDFPFCFEHVRMILTILLLIVKINYEKIDSKLTQVSPQPTHLEHFNELEFLNVYFNYLQSTIEKKLQTQAIKELKTEDELGYFEHSFRFSHSSLSNEYDQGEEENDVQQQLLKLSQFRRGTHYKTNIILGMPGAGKTTALYLLASQCIHNYNKRDDDSKTLASIPVVISLRSISIKNDSTEIKSAIEQSIGEAIIDKDSNYRSTAFKYIYNALEEGRVVLFFDGLNEILQSDVNVITDKLISLITNVLPDNSRIFISGRKYEYEGSIYSREFNKIENVGIWHLEELYFEQIENFLSPQIRSQVINGQMEELFSSPLNIRLFLSYMHNRQKSEDENVLEVPINRGEMLESFLADTIKDYNDNIQEKKKKINPFHATKLLRFIATNCHGKPLDVDSITGEFCDNKLLEKLSDLNILSITPADNTTEEQVAFSIDTFQEYYRADVVIDKLFNDSKLSFYSLTDDINPDSPEDFETLKLIFEVGSSPMYHYRRSRHKDFDKAKNDAIEFSARLAKDYLNPEKEIEDRSKTCIFDDNATYKANMNTRLLTFCKLTRNIPFSEDIKVTQNTDAGNSGPQNPNAKNIAEFLILNNLKLFRVKNPKPIFITKLTPERLFLTTLITAASNIGGKKIWEEIISTYWLFTLGILSPSEFNSSNEYTDQDKAAQERAERMSSVYLLLNILSYNCRDYIYLYDLIHNLHIYCIKTKKHVSCVGIGSFLVQNFLCFLPDYAKKHLYHHISEIYTNNRHDKQSASDINTILCYIGNSQLLINNFKYDSPGLIRIKELRYILRNYSDTAIQKFILSKNFFNVLQSKFLGAFIIRHLLFRLGLTQIMRDFLFKYDGLNLIDKEEVEGIMDMIPLQSIPEDYIKKHYDTDIYTFNTKQSEVEHIGTKLEYLYYGKRKGNHLISILDIEDSSLIGDQCYVGSHMYSIVNDTYIFTHKLLCNAKTLSEDGKLLPASGYICTEDKQHKVPYRALSPNTELSFYLHAEAAVQLYNLHKDGNKLFICNEECEITFPEQILREPIIRQNRILEIESNEAKEDDFPYIGDLTISRAINTTIRPSSNLNTPEKFEYLSNNMNIKMGNLKYSVFGQDESFLWVLTEKIVTSANILVSNTAIDAETKKSYHIHTIQPSKTRYYEFWFKASQKVTPPLYGTFAHQSSDGEYKQIPFCHVIRSDDGFNFKLRVFSESIEDLQLSDLHQASYLFANIPLQLISIEILVTNSRYSMWKLKKKGANCNVSKGELFVPSKQKGSKTLITVSGETRSTIKQVICKLYSYDNVSEKICFIAKKTKGKIGAGVGDYNLLKDLYLSLPHISSIRLPIEKESGMNPSWIHEFNIRFDIQIPMCSGFFYLKESKINFLQQSDERFLLWCNTTSEITSADELEILLKQGSMITLKFEDGTEGDYRIIEITKGECIDDSSMIIFSHCKPAFAKRLSSENELISFSLQSIVPVNNTPTFPISIRTLYPIYSVRYQRDIKQPGSIIIPKPVSTIDADSVQLNGSIRWKIDTISSLNNRYTSIALRDEVGRIPKIETHGLVSLVKNDKKQCLWYRHVSDLIDSAHPEKYHAEICDVLLEEIMLEITELDINIVKFFIQKSRASDLVNNPRLLKTIDNIPNTNILFNVCRVLQSDPLKGLEAYSAYHNTRILSSDTMPEGHNGRVFQWQDLVLIERNHRLTLVNHLPRYACLGYKTGFILSISETPNYKGRKKVLIVTPPPKEDRYSYFYNEHEQTINLSPAEHVSFFATVNYNNDSKHAAENVKSLGTFQQVVNATFIGKREENKQIIFSFQFNEDILDVSINEKAIHKAAIYKNLRIGQSYKIIKSFRNYILEQ